MNEKLQVRVHEVTGEKPALNKAESCNPAQVGKCPAKETTDAVGGQAKDSNPLNKTISQETTVATWPTSGFRTIRKTDSEIAKEVFKALKSNWQVPYKDVQAEVKDGWVTVEGVVSWNYQKAAVKKSLGSIVSVRGVTNNIRIESPVETVEQNILDDVVELLETVK